MIIAAGCSATLSRRPGCTKLPDKTARFKFALGSASGELQEVLVTDLPRSFDRGERDQ